MQEWMMKERFNPEEKIREVTEIYNRAGVKELVKAKIEDYLNKSHVALRKSMFLRNGKYVFMK